MFLFIQKCVFIYLFVVALFSFCIIIHLKLDFFFFYAVSYYYIISIISLFFIILSCINDFFKKIIHLLSI